MEQQLNVNIDHGSKGGAGGGHMNVKNPNTYNVETVF